MTDRSDQPGMGFDADRIMAFNLDYARGKLLRDGVLSGMWVAHTRAGEIMPIVIPDAASIPKAGLAHLLGLICAANDAWCIAMISEAWMSSVNDAEWDGTPPSESADRVEIIIVTLGGTSPEGEPIRRMSTASIERDTAGKVVRVEPMRQGDGEAVDSWLFQIPTGPADPHVRDMARDHLARMGATTRPIPTRH